MAGNTSLVTQRLKAFALGILLDKIRLYRPDSLMMSISCSPEGVSILDIPLSSGSTLSRTALVGSLYPSATATSLPTSHGVPSISTVRTCPNSGLVNVVKSFMVNMYLLVGGFLLR